MFTICKIENKDTVEKTYAGYIMSPSEIYQIPDADRIEWAGDDNLITDIVNDLVVINNGSSDITGISDAVDYLKSPLEMYKKESGILRVWASPRDEGTSQVYQGAGDILDPSEFGGDTPLLIDITDQDISKEYIFNVRESAGLKGGMLFWEDAPWGAYLNVSLHLPDDTRVAQFMKKLPIYKNNYLGLIMIPVERAQLIATMKIKIKVFNADVKSNFKVWGCMAMYRNNTDIV